ncbi:MAG: hypothetical protein MJ233_03720 [Mycoplasmoidaceae bacterium]|nr:hypothetical protein [Mycoplasmoidaceae bacterium]
MAYLSPGSMMVAKDRRTKQLYLLGMYVGLMYLNSDYRYYSTTDYYYMPWFDSYVNHNDEKWGGSGVINIFEHYYEDKQ